MSAKKKTPARITPQSAKKTVKSSKEKEVKKEPVEDTKKAKAVAMEEKEIKKEIGALEKKLAELKGRVDKTIISSVDVTRVAEDRIAYMEEILSKQPKMHIMIPLGIGEKKGATHEVGINGWVRSYPKGEMLEVPKTVFELLSAHFNITAQAGKEFDIDRPREEGMPVSVREALS